MLSLRVVRGAAIGFLRQLVVRRRTIEVPTGDCDGKPIPPTMDKGKLVGQKAPLKLRDIWAIRIRLQLRHRTRDLALFNLRSTRSFAPGIW